MAFSFFEREKIEFAAAANIDLFWKQHCTAAYSCSDSIPQLSSQQWKVQGPAAYVML